MKGKYDVYVIQIGNEFRVRPAVWAGRRGAFLWIKNMTTHSVEVTFADAALLAHQSDNGKEIKKHDPSAASGKDHYKFKLASSAPLRCYPYRVDVITAASSPAVGESDPIIILDPV